jgi:PAS domain S-box-containing protein
MSNKKEQLNYDEKYYESLFINAPTPIFIAETKTGLILDTNKAGENLIGRKRKEIIGIHQAKLHPQKIVDEVKKMFKEGAKRTFSKEMETLVEKKDGTLLPVSIASSVFKINGKEVIKGEFTDISKLKGYQKELADREEIFRTVVTNSIPIIFMIDKNGKFILSEGKMLESLGLKPGEAVGKSAFEMYKDYPDIIKSIKEGLKGKFVKAEIKVQAQKGYVYLNIFYSPYHDTDKKVAGVLGMAMDITENKINQQNLKEAEEKYRILFDSSKDALMTLAPPTWKFTSGNKAIIKMFNVKNEKEFIQTTPWRVSPKYQPDGQLSHVKAKQMIKKAMKEGSNFFEWTHKKINGKDFFATVLLTKITLRNKSFLQASVRDVTREKKVEMDLIESEERYRTLFENTNDLIQSVKPDATFDFVNNVWLRKLGYNKKEVEKLKIWDIIHPSEIEHCKVIFAKCQKGEKIDFLETKFITKSRKTLYVEGTISSKKTSSDKLLTSAFFRDVTSRKKAEMEVHDRMKEIAREKNKLSVILNNIGEGVFVVDKKQNIITVSNEAGIMAGFQTKNVIGKKYSKFFKFNFKKSGKSNHEFVDFVLKTGEKQKVPIFNHHDTVIKNLKTGAETDVVIMSNSLRNNKGKIVGCVVVFNDVTKEKEIDRAKSEFVSTASHQLRTPLSGIKWFSELLLDETAGKLKPKQKDFIKQMYESNERMIRLVNDLLSVSHIETGRKFDMNFEKANPKKIINRVLLDNSSIIKKNKLKVYVKCKPSRKFEVYADGDKLRQVFSNLINNSLKYSKPKGKVKIKCEAQKNNQILFSVQDFGYGIPKQQQKRIFEKFFRGENIITKQTEGTGLGLYIAKAIVETHKGKIWFESAKNKGTTFYFTIPKLKK